MQRGKDDHVWGVDRERLLGVGFALLAFGAWGLNPLYFKAVQDVPFFEVLAHRIVWAAVFLAILVGLAGRYGRTWAALKDRRTCLVLLGTTVLLTINWGIFIWAVVSGRVLESSLGYYVNPLVNVLLGFVFLRERLDRLQGLAVILAGIGVTILIVRLGEVPWMGLWLAVTFGIYGLLRKQARIEAREGLFVETLLVLPFALGYLVYVALIRGGPGAGAFFAGWESALLLLLAGPVTALPLVWFTAAARRLDLASVGFLQYLSPTGQFLLAVFVFGELFTTAHAISFGLIWLALVIFSASSFRRVQAKRLSLRRSTQS